MQMFFENTVSANPLLGVRWCIDQEELEKLRQEGAQNIHILFVVVYRRSDGGYQEEQRSLIPAEKMMDYISFKRPGKHTVMATIVWSPDSKEELRDCYLKKTSRRDYKGDIIDHYSHPTLFSFDPREMPTRFTGSAIADISVAEGFFAKEPPAWLSRWSNRWFDTEPRDQCQLRRRLILAFTLQPLLLALYVAFAVPFRAAVAAGASALGLREVSWDAVLHPFAQGIDDVTYHTQKWNSIFLCDSYGRARPVWIIMLNPISLFGLFVVALSAGIRLFNLSPLQAVILVPASILTAAVAHFLHNLFRSSVGLVIKPPTKEELEALRTRKEAVREMRFTETYGPLLCRTGAQSPALAGLPKEKRTFHLRFMGLKRRVCRKFAD